MSNILGFVAAHELGIGMIGTLVVVLGVATGIGRHHRRATERFRVGNDDS